MLDPRTLPSRRWREIHTATVEAVAEGADHVLRPGLQSQLVVTVDGTPVEYVRVADPGPVAGDALERAAVHAHGDAQRARAFVVERLRRRLGASRTVAPALSISVVMCTYRRPAAVAGALAALARLDPAPLEVVVVDNDPAPSRLRELVEAHGARYVREEQRGLNRARAAGARAARGDVVAFVDDDCVAPPTWLRSLPRLFADSTVGAVTGPGFAYELVTRPQVRRERVASFFKELRPRRYDWTGVWPVHSGRVGTGADMAFRRSLVGELDPLFPGELDAGTPTRSGGDLYALYRVLAAGWRVAYEPDAYFLHRHPRGWDGLHATIRGYGMGLGAYLAKVAMEERELAVVPVGRWLWTSCVNAALEQLTGWREPWEVGMRARYLAAGLAGPGAWRRARRQQPRPAAGAPRAPDPLPPAAPLRGEPDVAVMRQTSPAAIARAAGAAGAELVLLLAPGDRATAGLLDAHRRAHAGGRRIVLGRRLPERPLSTLAARLDWLERHDAARRAAGAIAPTVADLDQGHVSLPRDLVDDLDPALPLAAAVREVALGAEADGVEVVVAPDAVSLTTCEPDAGALLEAARERGRADAALVRRHPEAAAVLGVGSASRIASASPMDRAQPAVVAALGIVERARMRRWWWRMFAAAREAARAGAYRAAGGPLAVDRPPIPLDLLADDRLPPPGLAPPALEVCIGSRVLGRVGPERGWHPDLAEEAAALAGTELKRIAAAAGLPLASAAATEPAAPPDDVVQLALRGVAVAPEAVRLLGAALEGARVGVVLGVGLPAGAVAGPLVVHDRRTRPGTYPLCGRPPQAALVRRSLLHGLAPTAELGGMATLLEVAERAIDEGFAVAYREVPGILPAGAERPARARGEWDRAVARGALIARRARERQDPLLFAVRGALPFAVVARRMVTTGKPSPRHWAGTAAGFAVGAVRGARASEPGSPGQPSGRRRTGSVLSWLMNGDSTHVGSPSISMSG